MVEELTGEIPEFVMVDGEKVSTKGKLVSYKGGGYDGCVWEWNYFYITKEGELEILHSTGMNGIKNEADAEEVLTEQAYWHTTIYDVFTEEGMKDFDKYENVDAVVHSVFHLWFLEQNIPVWYSCDMCGERQTEMPECEEPNHFTYDPQGCGGIAFMNTTKLCEDCVQNRYCEECGEVDTRDPEEYPIIYNEEDCVARCSYCDGREE
jgi:hypothetical protein